MVMVVVTSNSNCADQNPARKAMDSSDGDGGRRPIGASEGIGELETAVIALAIGSKSGEIARKRRRLKNNQNEASGDPGHGGRRDWRQSFPRDMVVTSMARTIAE